MTMRHRVRPALSLALGLSLVGGVASAAEVEWSYEGEAGPAFWGDLSPDFATCGTGLQQSPVDIDDVDEDDDLRRIRFKYNDTPLVVENNGHTIEVPYESGSSIRIGGDKYRLLQFHFHTPSEHTEGGINAAMEAHFVHINSNSQLAVVGVLIDLGAHNDALAPVFDNMPATEGEVEVEHEEINARDVLPDDDLDEFNTYSGSLTTPPCSEGVRWFVLNERIEVSLEQLEAFEAIFPFNNRPVQPLNDRTIVERDD